MKLAYMILKFINKNKFTLKHMLNINGITLVEIIMTFAVLGVVICPLMTIFIMSQNVSNYSDNEYKSTLLAQKYMEEIVSMKEINTENYKFNYENGSYERNILQPNNIYNTKIKIVPLGSILYNVEIDVIDINGNVNRLESSKIFY